MRTYGTGILTRHGGTVPLSVKRTPRFRSDLMVLGFRLPRLASDRVEYFGHTQQVASLRPRDGKLPQRYLSGVVYGGSFGRIVHDAAADNTLSYLVMFSIPRAAIVDLEAAIASFTENLQRSCDDTALGHPTWNAVVGVGRGTLKSEKQVARYRPEGVKSYF